MRSTRQLQLPAVLPKTLPQLSEMYTSKSKYCFHSCAKKLYALFLFIINSGVPTLPHYPDVRHKELESLNVCLIAKWLSTSIRHNFTCEKLP